MHNKRNETFRTRRHIGWSVTVGNSDGDLTSNPPIVHSDLTHFGFQRGCGNNGGRCVSRDPAGVFQANFLVQRMGRTMGGEVLSGLTSGHVGSRKRPGCVSERNTMALSDGHNGRSPMQTRVRDQCGTRG